MARDRLDGVALFVATAEAGSFSTAAQRLSLTRSAVGKGVARLEDRLGVRLFHRTTRTQSLTADGELYYERCIRALEELRRGEALLASGRTEIQGRLKITMPRLFGSACVAPLLFRFAQAHPALQLDLRFNDTWVDLIGEGYDLAIRMGSPNVGRGLTSRRLASLRKVVCATPSYLEQHGVPGAIEDLAGHEVLVFQLHSSQRHAWDLAPPGGGGEKYMPEGRIQVDDYASLVVALLDSMGIAHLPEWLVAGHLQAGRLVEVLQDYVSPPVEVHGVWPQERVEPLRLRALIERLVDELPSRIQSSA